MGLMGRYSGKAGYAGNYGITELRHYELGNRQN